MSDTMNVTAQCVAHDPPVALHVDDDTDDAARVICPVCQTDFGSWAEVKTKMLDAAKAELQEKLLAPFRGRSGWKVEKG